MTRIGITGSKGFFGTTLATVAVSHGLEVMPYRGDFSDPKELEAFASSVDAVFHLAGINRAKDEAAFEFNRLSTERLATALRQAGAQDGKRRHLVFASSTKVVDAPETPYAQSKLAAETALEAVAGPKVSVAVFRLPNLFGPGAKPFYNSAISTFAWLSGKGRASEIVIDGDGSQTIELLYAETAAIHMLDALQQEEAHTLETLTGRKLSIKDIAAMITDLGLQAQWPELETTCRWYATRPALRGQRRVHTCPRHASATGSFQELIHDDETDFGQLSYSTVGVSYARGGHYHIKKEEWFIVLEGRMAVDFFEPHTGAYIDTQTLFVDTGEAARGLHVPAPYLHAVRNLGKTDIKYVLIANERFNKERPDTYVWGKGPHAETMSDVPL